MTRKQALRRAVGMSLAFGMVFAPYVAPADVLPTCITASVAQAASVGAEDVVLVGTIQTKFGAGTDWAPADPKTIMTKKGDTYEYTGKLPKGNYEYKIAIGGSWGENYGADGARDGANMKLSLAKDAEVTFIYDSITHETTVKVAGDAVANPKEGAAAQEAKASAGALQPTDVVLVGSLQDELGAGKEWDPSDAKTLMKPDGKGHRVFVGKLPKGNYDYKVALGGSWDVNYGKDTAATSRCACSLTTKSRSPTTRKPIKSLWTTPAKTPSRLRSRTSATSCCAATCSPSAARARNGLLRTWRRR